MKDEAVEGLPLGPAGLLVAHVHEAGPVEVLAARLLDHEDLVVQLLPLEQRVHVPQEQVQVLGAVPEREASRRYEYEIVDLISQYLIWGLQIWNCFNFNKGH